MSDRRRKVLTGGHPSPREIAHKLIERMVAILEHHPAFDKPLAIFERYDRRIEGCRRGGHGKAKGEYRERARYMAADRWQDNPILPATTIARNLRKQWLKEQESKIPEERTKVPKERTIRGWIGDLAPHRK